MNLSDYLDRAKLSELLAQGYVEAQQHPNFTLGILCYGRKAVLENAWDDVTMKSRGVIFNKITHEIVARPFPKFFNLEQSDRPETWLKNLPTEQPVITEKLDGSLAIGYQWKGKHYIASKASFTSDHAVWATQFYQRVCPNPVWPEGYTPIFEMICESVQHHVVHYGKDRLVLTALIDNETGWEMPYERLGYWADLNGLEVVNQYSVTVLEAANDLEENFEGYVASWSRAGMHPIKVKIKLAEFLRLQKILHHVSVDNIFEAFRDLQLERLYEWSNYTIPQFAVFVQEWIAKFRAWYVEIHASAAKTVKEAMKCCTTRKEFAAYFLERDYHSVCFAMIDFDKKSYQKEIWKLVERRIPKGEQRFAYDPELQVA